MRKTSDETDKAIRKLRRAHETGKAILKIAHKTGTLIYLASPYSDPKYIIRNDRAAEARSVVTHMFSKGYKVFSPVLYLHDITSQSCSGLSYEFAKWRAFDLDMLGRSDELWVLKMNGWRKSKGVRSEIRHAKKWGIPIREVTLGELERL